jgi:hypothetical protein
MSMIFSFDSPKLLTCLSMPSPVTLWCNFNHRSSLQQWRFICLQQCNIMKHTYNLQSTSAKTFSLWSLDLLQIWMLGFCVQVRSLQLASLNPLKTCQSFLRLGFNVQGFDHFQFSFDLKFAMYWCKDLLPRWIMIHDVHCSCTHFDVTANSWIQELVVWILLMIQWIVMEYGPWCKL